jgi:hypothetical protein
VYHKGNSKIWNLARNKGLAGKADYVVFATDYENYGAIYSCQSILFGHRRSASILSRHPTLDQPHTNNVCFILNNLYT